MLPLARSGSTLLLVLFTAATLGCSTARKPPAARPQPRIARAAPAAAPVGEEQPPAPQTDGAPDGQAGSVEPIYFDFDSFALTAEARRRLDRVAGRLRERRGLRVVIAGHTDDRGTTEYNLALGERRAQAALHYLFQLGVEPARIETRTFGEELPAARGDGEAIWALNRRDQLELLLSPAGPRGP